MFPSAGQVMKIPHIDHCFLINACMHDKTLPHLQSQTMLYSLRTNGSLFGEQVSIQYPFSVHRNLCVHLYYATYTIEQRDMVKPLAVSQMM